MGAASFVSGRATARQSTLPSTRSVMCRSRPISSGTIGSRIANDIRQGSTGLFIFPGFNFRVVRGLLTNFHLPQSSLLMLVAAFGGHRHVMEAYAAAIAERYRFYSYGDAMLVA